ncbi:MAG TPA: VWA domain-containing protein [Paludibaculum sp.]|jgi:VWFA-related protein
MLLAAAASLAPAQEPEKTDVVFKSDVSLVRVDVQAVDRDNRAITSLNREDFVLRDSGKSREIRNFATEEMPLDVLFLLDVSASMRPHVERIASAAQNAMSLLGKDDRIAIMVFDRASRVRTPFRNSRSGVQREFDNLLHQESFRGGTDITRGILDAVRYISRNGRKDARRAIVILTDDQTEMERDENRAIMELGEADTVLSALIAPDAMDHGPMSRGGGGYPRYPRSGGGRSGGGWGGIMLPPLPFPGGGGRGGPTGPTGPGPGPSYPGSRLKSAGTELIARESGGDSMRVDESAALETTLTRLRQRYSLYFSVPEGAREGQERAIEIQLTASAARRYPGTSLRYRGNYHSAGNNSTPAEAAPASEDATPTVVTKAPAPAVKRRPAGETYGSAGPTIDPNAKPGGWRRVTDPEPKPKEQ